MKPQYTVGTRFRVVGNKYSNIRDRYEGCLAVITESKGSNIYSVKFDDGRFTSGWSDSGDMEIIKNNNTIMSIKSKAALLFKSEPEKSFIKAGVLDESENFTTEGQGVFLKWLLKKNGGDFQKEVVTPILEEEKKNKTE